MAVEMTMPILVVDDYKTMVRIIRNLLTQIGFENVDEASDGTEAFEKMKKQKYGLVISDWNMEPMTGYELLQRVRADENDQIGPLHHGHRRIQDGKRDRGEKGRCEQLHREAVQCRNAEGQDGRGDRGFLIRVSNQTSLILMTKEGHDARP